MEQIKLVKEKLLTIVRTIVPFLCSLPIATSQFSVLISQKIQVTGWNNGNDMRNETCANTQTSLECLTLLAAHSLYCSP